MSNEGRWSVNDEPVLTDGLLLALYEHWQAEKREDVMPLGPQDERGVTEFVKWLLMTMPMRTPETDAEKQLIAMLRNVVVT